MKFLTLLFLMAMMFTCGEAQARLKISHGSRQVLEKVADLPDTEAYRLPDGSYFDLAILYEKYAVARILPLQITKEPVLVGCLESCSTAYQELSEEQIASILAENGLQRYDLLKLGFFTRYGGKTILGLLALLALYGFLPTKKKIPAPERV